MRLIAGSALRARLEATPPLIEGMIDPETQIQMDGVDFTLREVARFGAEPGVVDFDNRRRRIAPTEPLAPAEEGWLLPPGAYWIVYNEIVHVPRDAFALARTRSSLLRNGASVGTALWDSGYSGRSGSLLVVHHPAGLRLLPNARVVQLVFFELDEPAERAYAGRYQNENT